LTTEHYTDDAHTIRKVAGQCLKRAPLQKNLRLLGVRVAALKRADAAPRPSQGGAMTASESSLPGLGSTPVNGELFS
ncbi:MAG: DNA polymerase IV, partial [Rhodoferax sp.]|nr:DNA polymerase IV [Rhodoferax sp.]